MSPSMVIEANNKFTWVIKDFSSLQCEKIISDRFLIGGYKWRLVAYPKTTETDCLFLGVVSFESFPLRWIEHAKFSLKLVNQISEKSSILREVKKWRVGQQVPFVGFSKIIPFAELHSKDGGFLVNDELKIVAEVGVLQVIGDSDASDESEESDASEESEESQEAAQPRKKTKMDNYGTGSSTDLDKETQVGNETVDVNGFQVSTLQVASVRFIFEKHPDFASKVCSNNQHLKSSYMNALLGLIETLCQLPEKLSDNDLAEASAAVSYLTQVGFKVYWLEMKLEEVKETKKKMNTDKAQLQHMEEELQNLTRKCSDLKDFVEKQNADLSDANVAFSFDDVV